jgi:hypothetical protein
MAGKPIAETARIARLGAADSTTGKDLIAPAAGEPNEQVFVVRKEPSLPVYVLEKTMSACCDRWEKENIRLRAALVEKSRDLEIAHRVVEAKDAEVKNAVRIGCENIYGRWYYFADAAADAAAADAAADADAADADARYSAKWSEVYNKVYAELRAKFSLPETRRKFYAKAVEMIEAMLAVKDETADPQS